MTRVFFFLFTGLINAQKNIMLHKVYLTIISMVMAAFCMTAEAKKITINVLPAEAKIYVDGTLVGTGNYQLNMKNDFYVIKIEASGYWTRNYTLRKDYTKNTVLYQLPENEAVKNVINSDDGDGSSGIANRWFDITCRKGMTEEQVWKRLMNITTSYFSNVEVRDKAAGWIKTGWRKTSFTNESVRTRMEVRISFVDNETLTYRVRISSQIRDNECTGNNCYMTFEHVLKEFEPLIQELQTSVGGGE